MGWELFDPAEAEPAPPAMGPVVRVSRSGRLLLLNRRAWALLEPAPQWPREVVLVFDRDARVAGVRSVLSHEAPPRARLRVQTMRSQDWPYGVRASVFVDHYEVGLGEYPARWAVDLRMLTFEVGPPQRRPVGVPPGGLVDEDEGVAADEPQR